MARFNFAIPNAEFTIQDRFNFLIVLLANDHTITEAIAKAEMTLAECIYAHDKLLPDSRKLTIVGENGNAPEYQKIVESRGKPYRYEGNGIFRRVNKLGRPTVDGKSAEVDGATRIGFKANPLYYVTF